MSALIYLIGRGGRRCAEIVERVEDDGSALPMLEECLASRATLFDLEQADVEVELIAIGAEVEAWESEGMQLTTVLDGDYPVNLRSVHDRPAFLFVKGGLSRRDRRGVAVVGSRRASEESLRAANEAGQTFVEAGFTVFSGLAAGVDTAAHRGAIEAGGRTVAVLGTGLRDVFPKQNADLQDLLAENHAVVSQFWPDQPPTKWTFPQRNAVMSGMSLATLVIEASNTSGARAQAGLALAHGRPVILMGSVLAHGWARKFADRPGTYVVDDIDEAVGQIEMLGRYESMLAGANGTQVF